MGVKASLGILGGVFDPPHVGHVALARAAIRHYGLERLLVIVVADAGHKVATTPAADRLELVRLAFEDVPEAEVELDRHARTVDFLEERRPSDAVFVIGGDELADLATWKDPARVLELVRLGVAMRPGVPDERMREALTLVATPDRISFFEMQPVPVSSSQVRDRVARGEPIDGLVSERVAERIAALGLYSRARGYTPTRRQEG
jgi:nicotinate-nucleotide adenylyltransferase